MAGFFGVGFATIGVFTSSISSWVKTHPPPKKKKSSTLRQFPKDKTSKHFVALSTSNLWLEMCSMPFYCVWMAIVGVWYSILYRSKQANKTQSKWFVLMVMLDEPVLTGKCWLELVQPCTDSVNSTTAPCNFLLARRYWLSCCVNLSSMFSSMVLITLNWSAICVSKLCRRSSICPKCAHALLIHSLKTKSRCYQPVNDLIS